MGGPRGVDREPGFADAGLARKQDHLAMALPGAGPAAGDNGLLGRASVDAEWRRRHDLGRQRHGALGRRTWLPLDQTSMHRVGHPLQAELSRRAEPVLETTDHPAEEIGDKYLSRRRGVA